MVTVLEQLPCRPREASSKEECQSCALWEPRTDQVCGKDFLRVFPKCVHFGLIPSGTSGDQEHGRGARKRGGSRGGVTEQNKVGAEAFDESAFDLQQ